MKILKEGAQGSEVKRWQLFLVGQQLEPGPIDGDFGTKTRRATIAFQVRYGLAGDGVVGLKTLGQAMRLGFESGPATKPPVLQPPKADHSEPNWPPRPRFEPLTGTLQRQRLFGRYSYTHEPVQGNFENIRILGSWEEDNIVRVPLPQLKGVAGAPRSGQVRFHRRAAKQLQKLWQAWGDAGLLPLVLTWEGSYVPRFARGSKVLSNHAFGTAFDINYAWNTLGTRPVLAGQHGSVRELVPIANQHGFFWGGHFRGRPDGMHFEVAILK